MPTPDPSPNPSPEAPPPASLIGWYRFALMVTGSPETAAAILQKSFVALGERLSRLRTPAARRAWMVARIKKEATASAKTSPSEPWGKTAALSEPGRTAYALFQSLGGELLDQEELVELSGCRKPAALASALAKARRELLPQGMLPSDSLLPLHCPWLEDSPAVATAVRATEGPVKATLDTQNQLDEEWQTRLLDLTLPEGLSLPALTATPKAGQQLLKHPAMLAVAFSLMVMIGAVLFIAKEQMDEFPGKELVSVLVEETAEAGDQALEAIEPVETERLADWFLLKGFDDFAPPEELRKVRAEACRVFRAQNITIAHAALEPRRAELFVYHSEGLKPRVESRTWITFQQDDWAVATRSEGGVTFVVAFPGDVADMPQFLKEGR